MKTKRYTDEQISNILHEHEAGVTVAELMRKYGIGKSAIYRWKEKYGNMQASDIRKLKQLEEENNRLKRIIADQVLNIEGLKHVLSKKW
jgi:putative transposase